MLARLMILISLFSFLSINNLYADNMHLVLELKTLSDGKVVDRISLFANEIDPNISSIDDKFRLEHNGKMIKAPKGLLARLNHLRRGYSYDNFTKGIQQTSRKALCRMAGPAIGDILYVRYLTYQDHKIVKSEMRPVLSEEGNCLFADIIRPKTDSAEKAASKALASLQVLGAFQK